MALSSAAFYDSDNVGSFERIMLKPVAPATTTDAMIATAFYGFSSGNTPAPVDIDESGKSLSFRVLPGLFALTVTLVSPSPATQDVQLCQDETFIDMITLQNHSGSGAILIHGID